MNKTLNQFMTNTELQSAITNTKTMINQSGPDLLAALDLINHCRALMSVQIARAKLMEYQNDQTPEQ